jgi:hypothetical protein
MHACLDTPVHAITHTVTPYLIALEHVNNSWGLNRGHLQSLAVLACLLCIVGSSNGKIGSSRGKQRADSCGGAPAELQAFGVYNPVGL